MLDEALMTKEEGDVQQKFWTEMTRLSQQVEKLQTGEGQSQFADVAPHLRGRR